MINNRFQVSKTFYIDEFVNPRYYERFQAKASMFINPNVIVICQFLRDRFGALTVNNYFTGGNFQESGTREFQTGTGALFSQHKFGNAADCKFSKITPEEVRADIIKNFTELYKPLGLTTIEADTETWLHFDCRFILNQSQLNIVQP